MCDKKGWDTGRVIKVINDGVASLEISDKETGADAPGGGRGDGVQTI